MIWHQAPFFYPIFLLRSETTKNLAKVSPQLAV